MATAKFQEIEFQGEIIEFSLNMSDRQIMKALDSLTEANELDLIATQEASRVSSSIFDQAFDNTLGEEGGFQKHRNDRGNWDSGIVGKGKLVGTKFGITAMTYPLEDIPNLEVDQAKEIYFRDFWTNTNLDRLPPIISMKVFDSGANLGTSRAAKILQKVIGAKEDGIIGEKTIKKAFAMDQTTLMNSYIKELESFYKGLAKRRPSNKVFLKGWLARANRVPTFTDPIDQGQIDAEQLILDVANIEEGLLRSESKFRGAKETPEETLERQAAVRKRLGIEGRFVSKKKVAKEVIEPAFDEDLFGG